MPSGLVTARHSDIRHGSVPSDVGKQRQGDPELAKLFMLIRSGQTYIVSENKSK
jgi:hypothetical protein